MGKVKKNQPITATPKVPNPHLFARLNYLYQSSAHLSSLVQPSATNASTAALSRFYLSSMRSVAKKSVMRLGPQIKRTICKRCDTLLVPGISCANRIENASKGGEKSWADVLVVECAACGTVKRFPVGMDGKERKKKRRKDENANVAVGVTKEGLLVVDAVQETMGSSSGDGEHGTAKKAFGHTEFQRTVHRDEMIIDSTSAEEERITDINHMR